MALYVLDFSGLPIGSSCSGESFPFPSGIWVKLAAPAFWERRLILESAKLVKTEITALLLAVVCVLMLTGVGEKHPAGSWLIASTGVFLIGLLAWQNTRNP